MEIQTDTPKYKIFNRDACKYLAIFFMFWGHLAWIGSMRQGNALDTTAMPVWQQVFIHLSLFCPPVMFFFIADGYKYTRDRRKYALRLGLFALITQPFHWLIFQPIDGWWTSSVMVDLFFGLLVLCAWETEWPKSKRIAAVIGLLLLNVACNSPWELGGPLFILFLHIYRDRPKQRFTAYLILTLLYKIAECFWLNPDASRPALEYVGVAIEFLAAMAAYACMTVFYNGKKGRHPVFAKWFFYAFYPAHYLLIFLIERFTR